MAVSGSTNFELDVAEYIEEAFERCGLELKTGYDLQTAKRSLNLLFADWANRGLNQWTIAQRTQTVTSGTANYDLAADSIDVLSMVGRIFTTIVILIFLIKQQLADLHNFLLIDN